MLKPSLTDQRLVQCRAPLPCLPTELLQAYVTAYHAGVRSITCILQSLESISDARQMLVQAQLQTLASVCWSEPACPAAEAQGTSLTCRWAAQGFPQGPALLTYLSTELLEGDDRAKALLKELFLAAVQPYIQHARSWMYSIAPAIPAFGASGQQNSVSFSDLPELLQKPEVTTEVGIRVRSA